jgi:hypothetical protein
MAALGAAVLLVGVVVGSATLAATGVIGGTSPTPSASPAATPVSASTPDLSPTPQPTPTVTPTPTATPVPTPRPAPSVHEFAVAAGTEPSTAADPFHPGVVAVVTEQVNWWAPGRGCSRPAVRVSKNGGATWSAPSHPWGSACQDIHAVVAWGPNGRLWVGNAISLNPGVLMTVTHSDDFGKTWSKRYVENFNPRWVGCFASIAVDNWPASPNFGTVYVAYNWLPDKYGPGVSVMASRDGTTWAHTDVKVGSTLASYPYALRIGYRVEAAPDGTAFVSYYESDLKSWSSSNIFHEGSVKNVGRRGIEISRIHFAGQTLSADSPVWATSISVKEPQFDSGLAVDDTGRAWLAVENGGKIRVGPVGGSWTDISIAGKNGLKPSIAISGQTIFVGWHPQDKSGARMRTYYTISYDGGQTWLPPAQVTGNSWSPKAASVTNGVGLRENAVFANGTVYWAYGDARSGLKSYLAVIKP